MNKMTAREALSHLKSMSNEKVFAHNIRNGAAAHNQFGVKLGDIRSLANRIRTNHELALAIWHTKNIDARLLAALIIKPNALSTEELDDMVKSIDFSPVSSTFAFFINS